MSKRSHEDDSTAPDPKRARIDVDTVACWDDLIDDTKALIRRECPLYARVLLGMTCKAEYTINTRPAPRPLKLAQDLLMSPEFELMWHIDLSSMPEAVYHEQIVHFAIENASSLVIKCVLDRPRDETSPFPVDAIIPCPKCIAMCYAYEPEDMNAFLVDLLIDYAKSDEVCPSSEYVHVLMECTKNDELLGRLVRHFG